MIPPAAPCADSTPTDQPGPPSQAVALPAAVQRIPLARPAQRTDRAGPAAAAAPAKAEARSASAAAQRRLPSTELFAGAREIEIVHREQIYRLRQTALGKLILTK